MVYITREYIDDNYYILFSKELNVNLDNISPDNIIYIGYDYYDNIIVDKNYLLNRIFFREPKIRNVNIYPYLVDTNDNINDLEIYRNVYHVPSFVSRLNLENNKLYLSYYIDITTYEKILTNHESKHKILTFIDILKEKKKYMQNIYSDNLIQHLLTPRTSSLMTAPLEKESNLNLYKYQVRDIENMISMENGISLDVFYQSNLLNYNNLFFQYTGEIVKEFNVQIINNTICGGFLINEMGLGKTIECLELIHQTSPENNYITILNDEKCHYFYKRGNKKGTYCTKNKKSKYFCSLHNKTPFLERLKYQINYDLIENDLKQDINFKYFNSKATLIICPTQLCDQWITEYYNKFNNNKIVYMITTYEIYENLSLSELLYADIIVISYNLLFNIITKNYYSYYHDIVDEWNNMYPEYFSYSSPNISNFLENIVFNKNHNLYLPTTKNICFVYIKWNRIIFDEFHEICNNIRYMDELHNLKGYKKWIVTGTPFPKKFSNIKAYFKIFNCHINSIDDFCNFEQINNLFIRNTRESTIHEIKKIDIESNINLLNFNNYEKNIYKSYIEQLNTNLTNHKKEQVMNILLKLCCCGELLTDDLKIKIRNCKNFEDIQNVILENNRKQLEEIDINIDVLVQELEEFENNKVDEEDEVDESVKLIITNMKRELTIKRKEKETVERSYNYLKTVIQAFKDKESWSCPVCLTESDDIENIGITCCGHKFCWECLSLSLKDKNFCPQCKFHLDNNDYFEIKNETDEQVIENDELTNLINRTKSTKIGNIIWKIKSMQSTDKCIIFSQWDDLLEKVGTVLEQNNIKIVYCRGTIYQKNNSIKRFKNDSEIKVIMLSSENAASGLNLTEANKIIFVEPVYGTETNRKNIENQAVGRVNRIGQNKSIEIIRFIIQDTVEEDLIKSY